MTPSKPIEKWKFNLQIAIAILFILVYCSRAILFITYEPENKTWDSINFNLWYITALLGFISAGFMIMLLRSVPIIRNLLIVLIILSIPAIFIDVLRRLLPFDFNLFYIINIIDNVLEIIIHLVAIIVNIHFLRKKFDDIAVVKMLRPYAVACICIIVLTYLLPIPWVTGMLPETLTVASWGSGINYFLLAIPDFFLIACYVKIKSLND